jgi:hypothetical protein
MDDQSDIRIEVRLIGAEAFPAQLLLGTIEAAERAITRAEVSEIDDLQREFPDIPAAVFDAMRYRVKGLTGRALNFESASHGSIILIGAAVALAYWLLDKTLGETTKEAWQDSELNSRIKGFLQSKLRRKAEMIAHDIRPSRWPNADVGFEVRTEYRERAIAIIIMVTPGPEMKALPKASEVIARRRG